MGTMGESRVLCPNITQTLKSVIVSLCQSNIQFTSQLSVLGSIHVLADGEQVVSCLLKETPEKTRRPHNSHRREGNEIDQCHNAPLPSQNPHVHQSQNIVFAEPMESSFDPLLEIKTEPVDTNDYGLATASNKPAQDEEIMPIKKRKCSSHPVPEFVIPVAQTYGQNHSSDEMASNSSESLEQTDSGGSKELSVTAKLPKSTLALSRTGMNDSPANLSSEFCASASGHNNHKLESNKEVTKSPNTVFAEPMESTFDRILEIKTEAVDLNDYGLATASNEAAHNGENMLRKRKRFSHPAPEFIMPITQTDRQNNCQDDVVLNGPAEMVLNSSDSVEQTMHSASQETLVIHIKPAKLQESISNFSRTGVSSANTNISPEFQCTKCQDILRSKSDLQAHMQDCNPQNNRIQKTATMTTTTTTANNLTCRVCKLVFTSKASLREHSKLCNLKCHKCQQTFGLNSDYVSHFKNVHNKNLFSCPTCDHTFKSGDGLRCHMNSAHDRNKVYPCGLCPARFFSRQAAYFHRKKIHPGYFHRKYIHPAF